MSDEICIWFGEDGKAHAYNSEFDVTIHCENEQEMNEAVDLLNLANRLHWRKTDVTPPTEEDADAQVAGGGEMKKAVLISIRPEWCKKIITKEKTVEIRKTMPSVISEPFKCYIYCTNGAPLFYWKAANRIRFDLRPHDSLDCKANGMVVGEFTCNGIDFIQRMGIDNNFDYCYLSLNEFGNDDIAVEITDVKNPAFAERT